MSSRAPATSFLFSSSFSSARLRGVLSCLFLAGVLTAVETLDAPTAHAYPSPNIELSGHGFGHGRGMGQWGALGYAVDRGFDHRRILDHFYANTTEGSLPGNVPVLVQLTRMDGRDTIVQQERGKMITSAAPGTFSALRAVRVGTNLFRVDQGGDCGGGPGGWQPLTAAVPGPVVFAPVDRTDDRQDMLQVCEVAANRWYRGEIQAHEHNGRPITINSVAMEDYLRGVLPREMPASWGDLAGGRGMAALRAQAVTARSYAFSEDRAGPARTCDTASCQVYGGRAEQSAGGFRDLEDARTDRAVAETGATPLPGTPPFQVRLLNTSVARTEYSSSTGGWTAGGTFPPVRDEGDAIASNPHHNWRASVPVSAVEAKYGKGTLTDVHILTRNGLGAEGGRVLTMRLVFSGGTVDQTGEQFRRAFALRSSWFSLVNQASFAYHVVTRDGGVFAFGGAEFRGSLPAIGVRTPARDMAEGPGGGYWILGEDGGVFSFGVPFHGSMGGRRLNQPVVGMTTTASGGGYWLVAGDGGIFTFGDAVFHGSTGNLRLNQPVVGMAPTPSGGGYWLVATDGGVFTFGDAVFHGSTGNLRLNQPVFAMAPTPSGRGYWLVARDGGIFTFGDASYLGSLPERRVRETAVEILPSPSGAGYLIVTAEGRVHAFGDATSGGGPRDLGGTSPAVGAGRPRA